eukprot:2208888-Heterocapsa_arctica.AAC.1
MVTARRSAHALRSRPVEARRPASCIYDLVSSPNVSHSVTGHTWAADGDIAVACTRIGAVL